MRFNFQLPDVEAFGNCAEEIHWGLLRARREKTKVFLIFLRDFYGPLKFSKKGLGINSTLKNVVSPHRTLSESHSLVLVLTVAITAVCFLRKLVGVIGEKSVVFVKNYSWGVRD